MKLINKTQIPDSEILELIKFAKPASVADNFTAVVKEGKNFAGFTFRYFQRFSVTMEKTTYPTIRNPLPRKGGYLTNISILNETEYLLFLLSHELQHMASRKHTEGSCDRYGLETLDRWRKAHGSA